MPRPCECDEKNCRLCWLWHNDERYKTLWSGEWTEAAESHSQMVSALQSDEKSPVQPERHYVINLKRRSDRLKEFIGEAKKTGFKINIFQAIDGKTLEIPDTFMGGPGAYGCKLSHMKILEECMKDGIKCVGVYEDDCVFPNDFKKRLAKFLSAVPQDWNALFLGGQHMSKPEPIGEVFKATNCHRTHAYWARGNYIKVLYDIFKSSREHIDKAWAGVQPMHQIYVPEKWMANQAAGYSDIYLTDGEATFRQPPGTNCNCAKTAQIRQALIQANQAASLRKE